MLAETEPGLDWQKEMSATIEHLPAGLPLNRHFYITDSSRGPGETKIHINNLYF